VRIKFFKKRKFTKSYVVSDLNLHAQLTQSTIAKLCPPSCLHLQWNSLHLLEEADKHQTNINCNLDNPFLESEITVINNMNLKSAPGIDQIDYSVISSLPREYFKLLLSIYNKILYEGVFPDQWKYLLIPKPGGNFHPISLLSCFLKIIEKMIYNCI